MNNIKRLQNELLNILISHKSRDLVIVCVGTDRSTGDSLAPLVGWSLSKINLNNFHVYGTMDEPVHAVNLSERLDYINSKHKNPYIIGIDACLGGVASIGKICVENEPLLAGAGLNKELPPVGECSITGVVNVSGFMEFLVLQNTRLSVVMKMANEITDIIKAVDEHLGDRKIKEKLLVKKEKRSKFFGFDTEHLKQWIQFNQ